MGIVQVRLPDEVQQAIDRQVAEGRATGMDEFLAEAARRYAADLEIEQDLVAAAGAGIADLEAGRFRTVSTPADLATLEDEVLARARSRLSTDQG